MKKVALMTAAACAILLYCETGCMAEDKVLNVDISLEVEGSDFELNVFPLTNSIILKAKPDNAVDGVYLASDIEQLNSVPGNPPPPVENHTNYEAALAAGDIPLVFTSSKKLYVQTAVTVTGSHSSGEQFSLVNVGKDDGNTAVTGTDAIGPETIPFTISTYMKAHLTTTYSIKNNVRFAYSNNGINDSSYLHFTLKLGTDGNLGQLKAGVKYKETLTFTFSPVYEV
ncbi:MAG: hypothetical protein LBD81_02090 [Holosporaceae bacterium]|jgi:hypothetical protein|nr:hypothetical protein [Holosporaceae bacterium]